MAERADFTSSLTKYTRGRRKLAVRLWGVRGSIACGGPDYARYGGNTSCVEVNASGRTLIFDCGTGLRPLGNVLERERPFEADIFLSHTHVDHIVGLPFFTPLYHPENYFRLWSGHLAGEGQTKAAIQALMAAPIFPVDPHIFKAKVEFRDFNSGDTIEIVPGLSVQTAGLNHPNGATGYRVECEGAVFAYVTDTEHHQGTLEDAALALMKDADVAIYDATYTDDEYPKFRGFGHSTWQEGLKLAVSAGVKTLVLFHHDPAHTDKLLGKIEREASRAGRRHKIAVVAAREGMVFRL